MKDFNTASTPRISRSFPAQTVFRALSNPDVREKYFSDIQKLVEFMTGRSISRPQDIPAKLLRGYIVGQLQSNGDTLLLIGGAKGIRKKKISFRKFKKLFASQGMIELKQPRHTHHAPSNCKYEAGGWTSY